MAEIKKKFSLKFTNEGNENADLNISLSWSQEGISSLCVMMFQPRNKLDRIWLIRTLDDNDDWTADKTIDTDDSPEIYVYGMTSAPDQPDDCFEVLISAHTGQGKRTLILDKHFPERSILKKKCGLDKFQMNRPFARFTPPDYRLVLKDESFPDQRDAMMVLRHRQDSTEYLVLTNMSQSDVKIPLSLPSRNTYNGLVIELQRDLNGYKSLRISEEFEMNTVMTKEELVKLMEKAEEFVQGSTHEVKIMFRNKPRRIMDEIMDQHNGLMKKYIKDNNGDPYSPVNGSIHGLFFSVSPDKYTGGLPNFSNFGDRRLHVPVEVLFTEETNLFFTDFYCHNLPHYVTVILTKQGSDTDAFCHETLLLLDQYDNPFLYRADGKVHTTKSLHVEVLYTEDVDIKDLQAQYGEDVVKFSTTLVWGNGESSQYGIRKDPRCRICNL